MRALLDTDVFLYVAASAHAEKEICVRLLRRVAAGSLEVTTNSEVVQEVGQFPGWQNLPHW